MIAVLLNAGGGVRLIKPAKLYMCTQTHYKHDENGRSAPDVRGHSSVPLSHSGTSLRELDYTYTHIGCPIRLLACSLYAIAGSPISAANFLNSDLNFTYNIRFIFPFDVSDKLWVLIRSVPEVSLLI